MTYIEKDKMLYEELESVFRGSIQTVAAMCKVHRNTVRRVLRDGFPSAKRPDLRKAAEEIITGHATKAVNHATMKLQQAMEVAERLIPATGVS